MLSTNWNGAAPAWPGSGTIARLGPKAPACSQNEDEPGPPLNMNTTGRVARSGMLSRVYANEKTYPIGVRLSSSISVSAAVAEYATATPLKVLRCRVTNCLGTGMGPDCA